MVWALCPAAAQPVALSPAGLFLLPARHGAATAALVFDTGSSLTVIDSGRDDLAREPTPAERAQFAGLLAVLPPEQSRAARLGVSSGLRYGATLPAGEPVLRADLHPLSALLGAAVAGLLGLADLRRLAWTIENGRLQAGATPDPRGCIAPVQDNRTWVTLPATFGPLTVPVQLDTGSNVFLRLSPPTLAALARLGLLRDAGSTAGLAIGGAYVAMAGRVARMRVGPVQFTDLPVQAGETDALGLPFLTGLRRAVLDFPHSRLCLVAR